MINHRCDRRRNPVSAKHKEKLDADDFQQKRISQCIYTGLFAFMLYYNKMIPRSKSHAFHACMKKHGFDFLLYQDIWKKKTPYILTSGTLSVGGDFSRYKQQAGLSFLEPGHVLEVSKASPFDYNEHALLYLPKSMPFPDVKGSSYLDAVVKQISELVKHTWSIIDQQ